MRKEVGLGEYRVMEYPMSRGREILLEMTWLMIEEAEGNEIRADENEERIY